MNVQGLTATNNKNNNFAFKAYLKEDSVGHLKNLYSKVKNHNELQKAIDLLQEKRPNHELEILEAKYFRGTEENPRVDWREATRSMWKYLVRNNENGRRIWVCTPAYNDHLTQLGENLANFSDDVFWRSKAEEENLYKSLVTPNNKVISTTEKPKKMKLVNKIKDFVDFWTLILKKDKNF